MWSFSRKLFTKTTVNDTIQPGSKEPRGVIVNVFIVDLEWRSYHTLIMMQKKWGSWQPHPTASVMAPILLMLTIPYLVVTKKLFNLLKFWGNLFGWNIWWIYLSFSTSLFSTTKFCEVHWKIYKDIAFLKSLWF